ncbi:hypothetical protein P7K49_014204 [Saguinus oedipus]|uniref:Uncharacterized protein n=1 Tax=Saguinus oedipus TaxID=9490 RepID=A0ABQ9VI59_SAGOE|nr:hypothetical protein P7K49_014204 [Saguinus oedipus]
MRVELELKVIVMVEGIVVEDDDGGVAAVEVVEVMGDKCGRSNCLGSSVGGKEAYQDLPSFDMCTRIQKELM